MFLIVFRNRKREDIDADAYLDDSMEMEVLAAQQPGFLAFRSYTSDDGEVLSISEWESESTALAWSQNAKYRIVQQRGVEEYYESYTLYLCDSPRVHSFGPGGTDAD